MKDHLANSSLNEKIEFFKTEFKKSLSKQDVSSLNKLLLIRDLAIINGFNFMDEFYVYAFFAYTKRKSAFENYHFTEFENYFFNGKGKPAFYEYENYIVTRLDSECFKQTEKDMFFKFHVDFTHIAIIHKKIYVNRLGKKVHLIFHEIFEFEVFAMLDPNEYLNSFVLYCNLSFEDFSKNYENLSAKHKKRNFCREMVTYIKKKHKKLLRVDHFLLRPGDIFRLKDIKFDKYFRFNFSKKTK